MSKMNMFARLVKVDEGKRLVTGLLASETPDVDGEIFDYDASKANFAEWSSICHKASGGKSVGNLRAMHGKVAAGSLTEIIMDDLSKSITITANVVDDNEWEKIQKGVYSGFSVGGSYGRKWKDEGTGHKRYEAKPAEASLADIPCNLDCTFEVVKSNGSKELRKFIGGGATGETVEASGEGDSAASSDSADSQPRSVVLNKMVHGDMLKALEKMPDGEDKVAAKEWLEKTFKVSDDPAAPPAVAEEPPTEPDALTKLCTQIVDLARENNTALDLVKSMFGYDGKPELAKGLCDVGNLCDLFSRLGWAKDNAKYEAAVEGDGSAVPAMFAKVMKSLGDVLIAMVQEEVSEALSKAAGTKADAPEELEKIAKCEDIKDLRRFCTELAKAVGKNSRAVDEAIPLLKCAKGESVLSGIKRVVGENERLSKTLGESERGASELNKALKAKDAEIDSLKKAMKLPAADPKAPRLKVVGKGGDVSGTGDEEEGGTVEKVMGANGEVDEVATAIKASHQAGGQTLEKKLFGNGAAR